MIKQQMAWAIDTGSKEGHGFIGRYWWFPHLADPTPPGVLHTYLFATRAIAREALRLMKNKAYISFPKAKVARVRIQIESIE